MNNLSSPAHDKNENVATSAAKQRWMKTVCSSISALLQQGDQNVYDVTFIVGIEKIEIGAHRFIPQIQSPKLKKMFESDPTPSIQVVEDDVTPTEFRKFLQYLYTGDFTDDNIFALPLLQLAVKYEIPDLQKTCTLLLEKGLDLKSAVYEQACKYEQMNLKQKCLDYICRNGNKILDSSEFLQITKEIIALDKLRAENEIQVFKAVLRWGEYRCLENYKERTGTNLRLELEDLIPFIRFPVMNKSYFSLEVAPSQILTNKEIISVLLYCNVEESESKKRRIAPGPFSAEQRKWINKQDMPVGTKYMMTILEKIQLPTAKPIKQLQGTTGGRRNELVRSMCSSCIGPCCCVVAHSTTVTPTVVLGLSPFGPYYLETLKSSSKLKLIPEYDEMLVHLLKLRSSHSIWITEIYINKSYSEGEDSYKFDLIIEESSTSKEVFKQDRNIVQTAKDQTPFVALHKPFLLCPETWYTINLIFRRFYNIQVYEPINCIRGGVQKIKVPVVGIEEPILFEIDHDQGEDNYGYFTSGLIPMIGFKAN